jgi:hypothetical protein
MKTQKIFMGIMAIILFFSISAKIDAAVNDEGEKRETSKESTAMSTEEQLLLLNEKVRKLEEMVERQQRMIEKLQSGSVAAAPAVLPAAVVEEKKPAVPDEQTKKVDSLFKSFGHLNISGDLRFRYDGQYNQGFDNLLKAPARNRVRLRARLQLAGRFNNNFDMAVRIATGSFTDPISTNQTATDFFNRKPVGFDRYFIRYNSKTEPVGIILQGGKFDFPWKRTQMTFDNDLQPEGAAETIYFKGKGGLKEVRLVAFQLPFNEVSAGKDSALFGGQLLATVGSGNWAFTSSATYLNFNRADAVARAVERPPMQIGGLELGTTNRVRRDAAGNIIGFLTNFNLLDVIGEVSYSGSRKYPVSLLFNYVRNMSNKLDRLGERNGYWAEFSAGQLREKGDIGFTYTFAKIEQDSVLSPFNFSDFLSTNSRNNRFSFGYMINNNVFLQYTGITTERFNTASGRESRNQFRQQLDMTYRW